MKAIWKGAILAQSEDTIEVEGNAYFPPNSLNESFFEKSNTKTTCPWKGEASYYNVVVDGNVNKDAAWYYPQAKDKAKHIEGYVAFWKGVEVKKSPINRIYRTLKILSLYD